MNTPVITKDFQSGYVPFLQRFISEHIICKES